MDPHTLVRRLFDEAVNRGHVELINELYSPTFTDHAPGPGQPPGPAGIIAIVERYRLAIPDLTVTVEEVVVSGDRVVTRETWRGTHMQEVAGIPATGEPFTAVRMHIFRMEDGVIAEEWTAGSILDVLRTAGG
jgi:steroid delta-isomerase-like uncharacterized protein